MTKKLLVLSLIIAVAGALAIPAWAKTRAIKTGDNFFKPSSLTIKKDDRLTWRWSGGAPHNVRIKSGPRRYRKYSSPGGVKTPGRAAYTFTRRGTYRIVCDLHAATMKMTVRVQ